MIGWLVNNEVEAVWKELTDTKFETFIQNFSEESEKNYRKPQIFSFPHPRTSQIIAAMFGFINQLIIIRTHEFYCMFTKTHIASL
jgi:hypothetical protein